MTNSPKTNFSRRSNWPNETNRLTQLSEELKQKQIKIFDLSASNPTQCNFQYLKNEIFASLVNEDNRFYSPDAKGMPVAREEIARYYHSRGFKIKPEQIFLTASTSEAYTYLFRLLVNVGDQAFYPAPSYPLFQFLGGINDVQQKFYSLHYDREWSIDMSDIEALSEDTLKAVLLVNPNNPTGSYVKCRELEKLNTLAREHNFAIISDEVFFEYPMEEDAARVSLLENSKVLTFVLGGISKLLGLPQMKLSWIIVNGPKALLREASSRLEIIADTYLSVSTPTQNALKSWLEQGEAIQGEILQRVRRNYKALKELSDKSNHCALLKAEGGWYAILKVDISKSEEDLVCELLKDAHVLLHPGYFFDFQDGVHLIISLLPEPKEFLDGSQRLFKFFRTA